jgi:hypothetical protein
MCEADVVAVMAKLKRNLAPFNITGVAKPKALLLYSDRRTSPARLYG